MYNLNILVTGGAGFIGSNIVETLLSKGVNKIVILDNLITGKKENIQKMLDDNKNVEFIYGDIANLEICRKAVQNIDIICHQAAIGSVPRSVADPLTSHIANVNGFLNILIAAKEEGIKRVVYASSSSVYGDHPVLPKVEENTGNVLSPYAATKAIDEIYAQVFTRCYSMECIGLRYFNIFGPRQDPNGMYAAVIPKFINLMRQGKQPTINGDGTFSRDFTYVENAVQANILALTTENKECFGQAFNIGAGGQSSLLKLIEILKKELKVDIDPIFGPNRAGDIPHSNADISKAQNMLGYNPEISFEKGMEKYINKNNDNDNSIFKIGSCRTNFDNYLKNFYINYSYSHTTKEVLQWLDILDNKLNIENIPYNQLIIPDKKSFDCLSYQKLYKKSNILLIEISSLKIVKYNNTYYNINYYRNFEDEKIKDKMQITVQNEEDLYKDLLKIEKRIFPKKVIFVGHLNMNFYDLPNFSPDYRIKIDNVLSKINNSIILSTLFKDKDYKDIFDNDINHLKESSKKIISNKIKCFYN
jgi:UDP-N-acetylglucosamine 4-epimerase